MEPGRIQDLRGGDCPDTFSRLGNQQGGQTKALQGFSSKSMNAKQRLAGFLFCLPCRFQYNIFFFFQNSVCGFTVRGQVDK